MRSLDQMEKDFPILRRIAENLLSIGNDLFKEGPKYNQNPEEPEYFLLTFAVKQLSHMKSILILIEEGQDRDAELISRTMLEGAILAHWVMLNTAERLRLWYWFPWLRDYKLLKSKQAAGESVDTAKAEEIEKIIQEHGHIFELKKGKYRKQWHNVTIAEAASETGKTKQYDAFYREVSNWVHWSLEGYYSVIKRKDNQITFRSFSYEIACRTLASASDSLELILLMLNKALSLGLDDKINSIKADVELIGKH